MGSLIAPPLATERVPSLGDWNSKVGSGIGALAWPGTQGLLQFAIFPNKQILFNYLISLKNGK